MIVYRTYAVATKEKKVVSEAQVERDSVEVSLASDILLCQGKKVRNGGCAVSGDSYHQTALSLTIEN